MQVAGGTLQSAIQRRDRALPPVPNLKRKLHLAPLPLVQPNSAKARYRAGKQGTLIHITSATD
jgi:hypothetical protein